MRGNAHVRFGERAGETDLPKGGHRASARLYRLVFQLSFDAALDLLEAWLEWAQSSLLPPFVELRHTIDEHLEAILNALVHGLSNARVEALNTRIRLITRRAYGFHSAKPLIGLAMLSFGGLKLALPGRAA